MDCLPPDPRRVYRRLPGLGLHKQLRPLPSLLYFSPFPLRLSLLNLLDRIDSDFPAHGDRRVLRVGVGLGVLPTHVAGGDFLFCIGCVYG